MRLDCPPLILSILLSLVVLAKTVGSLWLLALLGITLWQLNRRLVQPQGKIPA